MAGEHFVQGAAKRVEVGAGFAQRGQRLHGTAGFEHEVARLEVAVHQGGLMCRRQDTAGLGSDGRGPADGQLCSGWTMRPLMLVPCIHCMTR